MLADFEVVGLNLALRVFYGLGEHGVLDGLALLHAELVHETGNTVRAEYSQQVIFERQVETG